MYIFRRFFFHHLYRCVSARRTIAKHCHASIVVSFSPNAQRLYWWRTHTHKRAHVHGNTIGFRYAQQSVQIATVQPVIGSLTPLYPYIRASARTKMEHCFVLSKKHMPNKHMCDERVCVHCTGLPARTTYVCLMPVRNVAAF